MSKALISLALFACLCFVQRGIAAGYNGSGRVSVLNTADLATFGANTNWFELTGVAAFGNCRAWGQGTLFRLKDDSRGQQMYALLLSAYTSQAIVTIYADDTYMDNEGYCYAQQVVLGTIP